MRALSSDAQKKPWITLGGDEQGALKLPDDHYRRDHNESLGMQLLNLWKNFLTGKLGSTDPNKLYTC